MALNKLKGIMAEKGISQRKLAQILGVSKNTVNAKLNGRVPFDTVEATEICKILNIKDDGVKVEIFLR